MGSLRTLMFKMVNDGQYDPEKLGANCSKCVLREVREGGPVGPEIREDADVAVIAEAPAEKEVEVGRPLVGAGGLEFTNTLKALGIRRQSMNIHHAIACRAPENDLDKVMLRWQRANKKRAKKKEELLPSPIECCRPRLMAELDTMQRIITLGKVPYTSLTGTSRSIMDIRGGPVEAYLDMANNFTKNDTDPNRFAVRVLPTLHPAFVMRMRRWSRAFRSDLSRAFRWFTVGLGWKEPTIILQPTPDQLEDFLRRTDIDYTIDVETTIDDPTVAKLKTVGFGHEYGAIVVPFLSIEGPGGTLVEPPGYTSKDLNDLRGIIRDFLIDPRKMKIGHNAGYFDQMVLKQHFGVTTTPLIDTILLHRVVEPELPHKLGYVGSVYTDVVAWKDAHTATEAKTDRELQHYNAVDCVVTARIVPQLMKAVHERDQATVVMKDHKVQQVCVGIHENGMFVDRAARDVVAKELLTKIAGFRKGAIDIVGREMNMNSVPQLRDLLFEEWGIEPVEYTKLGDPSTNDESIRAMRSAIRANPRVNDPDRVVAFLDVLRRYRRVAKEYGTYVRKLVPFNEPLDGFEYEEDADEDERAESRAEQERETEMLHKKKRGLIMADGRVRPDYNAHGTTSGRLSSSNPNAQNWPKHLRKLIIPAPGNVIVGADADQLELRIITAIAQIRIYLEAFADKKDPHAMTASLMFGKAFDQLVPKSDQWDKLRKIAKGIKYASFYGSGDETVHGLVTSAEDENGNLMYPDLSLREVATLKRNWLKGIPELPKWWDKTVEGYRQNGYVRDPVWGRQRDFLDGEAFNEIVNHPIQSAGAHIIHESTFDLLQDIPFGKWGPGTGIISQVHDALYVECPESEAPWVESMLKKHMNRAVLGLDGVEFAAKPKTGRTWADV
jgi:uracil-DNA glycosylase family 4